MNPVLATSIRIGNDFVDLTSMASIQQLISYAMKSIHYFALSIALCIFLLAIVRNYTQFGEHMGVRFIASLLVCLVMIFAFPKICDSIQNATYSYSQGTSTAIENMFCWLVEQKPNAGKNSSETQSIAQKIVHFPESVLHSIQAAMCNIFYVNGLYIGKGIRDIVYFIFKCIYNGCLCLTPIFIAALLIPETKGTAVNFIVSCIGIALIPLCFLFGDLCCVWLAEHMWSTIGLGSNGMFWTLARTGQAMTSPVGSLLGYIAFGLFYTLIAILVYIILPFLFMKLFRAGSAGSPIGLMAGMIGKAVSTAVVGGAVLTTGGAAASAAAEGAVAGGASGAANAARTAAKSAQASTEKAASEIDSAMDGR